MKSQRCSKKICNLTAGFPGFQVAASIRLWQVTGSNIASKAKGEGGVKQDCKEINNCML